MMNAFEDKFHVGRNLTFAFIDSWAKHPMNLGDMVCKFFHWLPYSVWYFNLPVRYLSFITKVLKEPWINLGKLYKFILLILIMGWQKSHDWKIVILNPNWAHNFYSSLVWIKASKHNKPPDTVKSAVILAVTTEAINAFAPCPIVEENHK